MAILIDKQEVYDAIDRVDEIKGYAYIRILEEIGSLPIHKVEKDCRGCFGASFGIVIVARITNTCRCIMRFKSDLLRRLNGLITRSRDIAKSWTSGFSISIAKGISTRGR